MQTMITLEMAPTLSEASTVLAACGLPSDDIEPEYLRDFVVARDQHVAIGVAGVQLLTDKALLRSVAVLTSHRGAGLGSRLVRAAERHARDAGANEIFLLTHDAQQFFARHGYVEVARRDAPAEVQATRQFGSSCCCAAMLMRKTVQAG